MNNKQLLGAIAITGLIISLMIIEVLILIFNDHQPIERITPPIAVSKTEEANKNLLKITGDEWEKLNKKLLRDEYTFVDIRHEIINDFISLNKNKVSDAVKEINKEPKND